MLQAPYRQIAVDCQISQTLVNGEPALQLSADINRDNISGFPGLQLHLAAGRPYCVSAEIFNLLKAKKVDVEYKLFEGADHGGLVWFQKPVIELVVDWFEQKLGKPAKGGEAGAQNL